MTDISNIKIKNKGDIELPFVYEIPDDYIFYNTGDIFLSGIKPDEIDAGECKRSLRVINQNGILKIRLGCFYGTKEEAITAITYKYYNNPDIIHLMDPYLDKVNLSFEKQILRQTKIS